jgi:hypothetical protein
MRSRSAWQRVEERWLNVCEGTVCVRVREEEEAASRFNGLDKQTAAATLCSLFEPLLTEYAAWPDVTRYLAGVQAHIAEHAGKFTPVVKADYEDGEHDRRRRAVDEADESPFDCYRLSVLVDDQGLRGAPAIEETNPTYANLLGRVEMRHELGLVHR